MYFLNQTIDCQPLENQASAVFSARLDAEQLRAFCSAAEKAGRRLVALWGSEEAVNQYALHVALDLAEGLVVLTLPLDDTLYFPDLAPIFPAANRMQRATMDMLGITPQYGDQRPWLRHANWPTDYYPLRSTTAAVHATQFPTQNEEYAFVEVSGDGVHEIPVGPIHAGIIEPGHFRFSVVGERVLRLEERLGWKHKGIERRFVGMTLDDGVKLASRISGDSTVAYAWAYSQAAEAIGALTAPPRANWLRALLLERERIINHLGDLAYLGNDVALSFGLVQFMKLKEDCLRMNAALFGHRLLMDKILPGGVACDLDEQGALQLMKESETLAHELRTLKNIYDEHAGLQDRFVATGIITPKLARTLGVIGLAGRASGQRWDLRSQHPCRPYDRLSPKMALRHEGDVAARAKIRFDELFESLHLMQKIIVDLPKGVVYSELKPQPEQYGYGWIEGWRGDVLVALHSDAQGKIRRAHCHDPSWQNWSALEHAVINNIVPDFPLINKSFNLSYAGVDL